MEMATNDLYVLVCVRCENDWRRGEREDAVDVDWIDASAVFWFSVDVVVVGGAAVAAIDDVRRDLVS